MVVSACTLNFMTLCAQEIQFTKAQAIELVKKNAASLGLTDEEVKNAIVSDAYFNKYANTKMVYLQQGFKGLPLANTLKVIAFRDEAVVSKAGTFMNSLEERATVVTGQPAITAAAAVSAAAQNVNRPITQNIVALNGDNNTHKFEFPDYGASQENIEAKLMWLPAEDGKLYLTWQVKFIPVKTSDYFYVNVDAATGNVISKDNLTIYEKFESKSKYHPTEKASAANNGKSKSPSSPSAKLINSATYRVVTFPAESPGSANGTPTLVTNPWLTFAGGVTNNANTLGWHNDGTTDHDSTRGNNVWAREDVAATNGVPNPGLATVSQTPSPNLTFDFPFDETAQPGSTNNQNFARTQLFYWNNVMHDYMYQYGFDEVAGNFQNTNMGRGGLGNDYVIADAQDGSGTNNANFATPSDGQRPRMQMYLFDPSTQKAFKVNSPASLAGYKPSLESNFSTANKLADVGAKTGDLMMYNAAANDGCTALTGTPLAGKIALIDRGSCNFVIKVKNAENAGAIAVVMVNNAAGAPIVMGGTDNTITIPAVMTSLDSGAVLKGAMAAGATVNVTLAPSPNLDGDLDNGVMAHEFGHGISNRLTGGPSLSTCLSNGGGNGEQMGEGWSDFYGLMMTTDWATAQPTDGTKARGMGTYVIGQEPNGPGIRIYPYSTDMTINQWTYAKLATETQGEVHNVGEIWAATLWDMAWNLIQTNGINANLYNANGTEGNIVAMKLVTEGMKLQPCRPGMIDGRDGILKADTLLYGGAHSCAIWKAFARRGMGLYAKQGSSNNYTDGVADFTVPSALIRKAVSKYVADQDEELTYTITANCQCVPVSNYKVVDTLATNVTYVSGGTYNAADRTVTFTVPSLTEGQNSIFTLKVKTNIGSYSAPTTPLNETVASTTMPTTFTSTGWTVSTTRGNTGGMSLKATDQATASTQTLTSASAFPITGVSNLSFYHYYNTERNFDGGYVELSTDNGTTWFDAAPYMYQNGYDGSILTDSKMAFTGSTNGAFRQTMIKLSPFAGKSVKVRFVFKTNASTGNDGWYIDDIMIKNEAGVYNLAGMFDPSNVAVSYADTASILTNVVPLIWGKFTAEKDGALSLLKWSTLQEQNTASFVVERGIDGVTFEKIGSVKAAGNSVSTINYNFVDASPAVGVNYYRIKRMDKDGKFTYSEVRSLTFDVKGKVSITPNPATDKIVVTIPGNTKQLRATLYSNKGEKMGTFVITGETNRINLPGYAKGVYYVTIAGEDYSTTEKIVIE